MQNLFLHITLQDLGLEMSRDPGRRSVLLNMLLKEACFVFLVID